MTVQRTSWLALLALLLGASAPAIANESGLASETATIQAATETLTKGLLAGKVRSAANPLASAAVYAYQLSDYSLQKVTTDTKGDFLFKELPAGLYKIIAHKAGFLPAVVTLARRSAATDQFVDLQLAEDEKADHAAGADFWSVRKRIPTDVLRDMGIDSSRPDSLPPGDRVLASHELAGANAIRAEMQALAGVDHSLSLQQSQMSGGRVALDGTLGQTAIDFDGYFLQVDGSSGALDSVKGRQSNIRLALGTGEHSQVSLSSRSSRLADFSTDSPTPEVDFENFLVSWRGPVGNSGETRVSAQYTEESNFYSAGDLRPIDIPDASRTLRLEGSYSLAVGDQATFQTELRYRERQRSYLTPAGLLGTAGLLDADNQWADETVELRNRGGWRIQPTVLLEYGLTTKLRDGSLSFTPHAGFVLQLSDLWQALAEASYRVHDEADANLYRDFLPSFFHSGERCDQAGAACYRVAISREGENDNRLTVGAMHRQIGETSRLFFNEDFFYNLESLFLVRGDRLPELQFALTRRLTPRVLTTLESNLASGGGGVVYSVDDEPYENHLRYLVTSLDTQFQSTSTGLLLAFHQLQQELSPLVASQTPSTDLAVERLEVQLTQDLNFLLDLAADWAVHFNLELSRGGGARLGSTDRTADVGRELRQRILGGLAVRF